MCDYLSCRALSLRYAVEGTNSYSCWYRLLQRWRDQGAFADEDVRLCRQERGRPTYAYSERRVLELLEGSSFLFALSVRTDNREAIQEVMREGETVTV